MFGKIVYFNLLFLGLSPLTFADTSIESPQELDALVVTSNKNRDILDIDRPTEAGSRLGLSARENPASVAVVDRELMQQIGARDLQDAANILPGINLASFPGRGAFVSYRGFTGSQVNQLFNGIPLAYSIAVRPVDSWIYDRVEAVGGPSSFLYGASSVGGSLNYVTKTAVRVDQELTGRLSYGRFDTTETSIGVNQALNEQNWIRLDYSQGNSNGFIDRNETHSESMAFSWLSDITTNLSHTLAVEYQEETVNSPYWGTPTLQPQTGTLQIDKGISHNNYNVEDGIYQQRVRWLRSITDYQFNDKTALRNTFYHYRAERDYQNLEGYRYTDSTNSLIERRSGYQQRHEQEINGNRIELTHHGELFAQKSDWAFGFDFNTNHHTGFPTSSGTLDFIDPFDFDAGRFAELGIGPLQEGRSNRVKMISVFAENRQGLTDRLSLISALRYDHIDFELVSSPGAETSTSQWDTVSGRLGLVFELNDDVSLYTQYSTSSEPPGGTLTTSSNTTIDDFDISKGRQFEVGTKFNYWGGRGTSTIAAYHIVRKNFLVRDPNDSNMSIQVGQQTSKGLEFATSVQLTSQLRADGNIAFVDAEYDEYFEGGESFKGRTPNSAPNRVGNLWLIYQPVSDWQFGVGGRYVASVYTNSENTQKLPAYTLYDAYARYSFNQHIDITLRGRNLSDKLYAYSGSSSQYYVGEPRSVELTLDLKY